MPTPFQPPESRGQGFADSGAPAARRSEITFLGTLGLVPFVVGAIVVWAATPVTGTQQPSLVAQSMVLTYGGVIAAYMAGMGAGGLLFGPQTSREPMILGMVATLTAWLAVWTNLPFGIEIPLAWRHGLVLLVLVYILLRDLRAIEFGNMPSWYGGLRIFLTSVAGVSIFAVMIWLIANSQY